MADPAAPDPLIISMSLDTSDPERLLAELSRYVVLARGEPGCINVDLAASATTPARFVVLSKWRDEAAQRAHMDSPALVALAEACRGLLTAPAALDLLEPISVHDRR